jgi:hypothetical protein
VISQESGESLGVGMPFDDLPMSSVVYMGRGSFRMEAIALDAEAGIAQPIEGIVTAPLHAGAGFSNKVDAISRTRTSGTWRVPSPEALFGSQDDVRRMLPPPTGAALAPGARKLVLLPRAALAGLAAAVFACGLLAGGAARSITVTAGPAPVAAATIDRATERPIERSTIDQLTVAQVAAERPAIEEIAAPSMPAAPANEAGAALANETALTTTKTTKAAKPPLTIDVPAAVKISARKRPAHHAAASEAADVPAPLPEKAPFKPWVDPFAQ